MRCPICNDSLIRAVRQGVELDYCPHFCGVWLDRGELDKIIQRSPPDQRRDRSADGSAESERSESWKLLRHRRFVYRWQGLPSAPSIDGSDGLTVPQILREAATSAPSRRKT